MEFLPNETYCCYGRVDTKNSSDGISNYLVTLADDSQINLKVTNDNELVLGNVYSLPFNKIYTPGLSNPTDSQTVEVRFLPSNTKVIVDSKSIYS